MKKLKELGKSAYRGLYKNNVDAIGDYFGGKIARARAPQEQKKYVKQGSGMKAIGAAVNLAGLVTGGAGIGRLAVKGVAKAVGKKVAKKVGPKITHWQDYKGPGKIVSHKKGQFTNYAPGGKKQKFRK